MPWIVFSFNCIEYFIIIVVFNDNHSHSNTWSVLLVKYKINVYKFRKCALDNARELTSKYSWYYLPHSAQKILIHASDVIQYLLVSIGELFEEVAESGVKMYRPHHTRKN